MWSGAAASASPGAVDDPLGEGGGAAREGLERPFSVPVAYASLCPGQGSTADHQRWEGMAFVRGRPNPPAALWPWPCARGDGPGGAELSGLLWRCFPGPHPAQVHNRSVRPGEGAVLSHRCPGCSRWFLSPSL